MSLSLQTTPTLESAPKIITSNALKIVAILAMTVDHLADVLFPAFPDQTLFTLLHIIGRLTAPIMFFCICEGFHYTNSLPKYLARLFGFALISHFAYCFAFGISPLPFSSGGLLDQTSIMWGLAWAVVALWVVYGPVKFQPWQKIVLVLLICFVTLPADWGCVSVLAVLAMYAHRGRPALQAIDVTICTIGYDMFANLFLGQSYNLIPAFVILVYPLLALYNGKRGHAKWLKWFFYIYYPAHLAIIGLIRLALYGNIPLF